MIKPCKDCLVLANCSKVCYDFLQWIVDERKSNLEFHPHYDTARITSKQIAWLNKRVEKRGSTEGLGFLFAD